MLLLLLSPWDFEGKGCDFFDRAGLTWIGRIFGKVPSDVAKNSTSFEETRHRLARDPHLLGEKKKKPYPSHFLVSLNSVSYHLTTVWLVTVAAATKNHMF